jgi:hypothetical protein
MKLIMGYLLIILERSLKRNLRKMSLKVRTRRTFLITPDQKRTIEMLLLLMHKKTRTKNKLSNNNRFKNQRSSQHNSKKLPRM